ncbi:hypothetical protein CLF_111727 [Clonorchis sinensis]|uniref:Uncharacterized protein n=1 Tax=Clonorchis sinensis TaxID=79923 RepID=G7YV89_CLOSI|nr:hypothetical protein CLF_111727 [Clonorchis sinensis]
MPVDRIMIALTLNRISTLLRMCGTPGNRIRFCDQSKLLRDLDCKDNRSTIIFRLGYLAPLYSTGFYFSFGDTYVGRSAQGWSEKAFQGRLSSDMQTNGCCEAVKDSFYRASLRLLRSARSTDIAISADDANAQVGRLSSEEGQLCGRTDKTRRMKQHLYCYSEKHRESPTPYRNRNTSTGTENPPVDSRHCVASPPLVIDNSHSGHISGQTVSAQVATSIDYAQCTPVLVNTLGSADRQVKCVSFLETQQSSAVQAHPGRSSVPTSSVSSSLLSNRPSLSLSAVLSAPLQLVRTSPKPTTEPDPPSSTLSPQSKPTPLAKPMVLHISSSETGVDSTQTRVGLSSTFKHMGNVARIPLSRSHSRTSPYDRSHRSTSPEPSAVTTYKEPNGLTDSRTSAFHLPHQLNRPQDLDISSPDSVYEPSMPLSSPPRNDPYSEDSPTRRTQSPDLSLCSLASDDLMLDTGLSSPVATPDSELDARMKRDKFFGLRDSMIYSRLESVTELSHDDLTHPEVPELREASGDSKGHCSPSRERRDIQQRKLQDPDSPLCICPSSANCDCKSCEECSSFHNRRRRTTASVSGSFGRFSLRRLRSRPRSLSYSQAAASPDPSGSEGLANLGDRTFFLLGTDQRQMLQELQSVKTTLLRLRRLLSEEQIHVRMQTAKKVSKPLESVLLDKLAVFRSNAAKASTVKIFIRYTILKTCCEDISQTPVVENIHLKTCFGQDQWHLPVFHEQLRMTEPTKFLVAYAQSSHIRPSLPPEWLSPLDSDVSEPSSHISLALGRQQTMHDSVSREPAWVDNKGDTVLNKTMETSCMNADDVYSIRSPRFSVDSDVVTKLVELAVATVKEPIPHAIGQKLGPLAGPVSSFENLAIGTTICYLTDCLSEAARQVTVIIGSSALIKHQSELLGG